MKIGVSTVQTRAKIIQTSKQCSSCSSLCPDAHTAAVVAGERVHASAIAPDLGVGALILVDASKLPVPFPFSFLGARSSSSGQNRVKPPPLVAPAVPRHPAPCFSRQSLPRLAPHSRCTAPTPIRPLFGPNRTPRPSSVVAAHRSSAPLDELLPPAILRPKSIPGEFPRGLLVLPDLLPTRIGAAAVESKPRRRGTRRPPPACAAGPPCARPRANTARPAAA